MYTMKTFAERLQYAANLAGLSQVELCAATGIPKSAMSQYFSGAFKPKQSRTYLLANALGVDAAWLIGYDVPMTPKDDHMIHLFDGLKKPPIVIMDDERDGLIMEIMDLFLNLPPKAQEEAKRYLRYLAQQATEENP